MVMILAFFWLKLVPFDLKYVKIIITTMQRITKNWAISYTVGSNTQPNVLYYISGISTTRGKYILRLKLC